MKTVTDLLEDAKRRTVLLCLWVLGLAYLMSLTSHSVWINMPVALLLIAMVRSLSGEIQIRWRTSTPTSSSRPRIRHHRYRPLCAKEPRLAASGGAVYELWRQGIEAPEVESALEELTQSVVKEWVTTLWFRSLSTDQEFPDELTNLINNIFAELSQRVKRINLITLLTQDIVDLVASHLELFRRTQARVGADLLGILSTEERDENIKHALAAAGELHPALVSPEAEYKVLHKLMGGVVALVLRPEDGNCKVTRSLSRELLACAVMRPVMNLLSPNFINTLIENAARNRTPPVAPSEVPKPATKRTPERSPNHKESSGTGLEMVAVAKTPKEEEPSSSPVLNPSSSETSLLKMGGSGDKGDTLLMNEEGFVSKKLETKGYSGNYGHQSARDSKENWAQLLEVVNQRKKQALAPEHLDNLWTKGRNYKKKEVNKPATKSTDTSISKEQTMSHPLAEPLNPRPKCKQVVNPKKTTELVELRVPTQESSNASVLQSESTLVEDDWTSKIGGADKMAPRLRRSRSSGAELDGWQALAHSEEGIPSLLLAGDAPGLGPGYDPDVTLRRMKGKQKYYDGTEKLSPSNLQTCTHLQVDVVGAHFEKGTSKTFAVYSIFVTDLQNRTWEVQRRFRNFEQLHRSLKDKPYYNLSLPGKRFLSSNLDNSFIQQRCALLDKYLKELLAIPSIAEMHEVWDFLSANSQTYAFGESPSMFQTLTSNVDDAVDDMFRQFRGSSDAKSGSVTSVNDLRKQLISGNSVPHSTAHLPILTNPAAAARRPLVDRRTVSQNVWEDEDEDAESTHDVVHQHLAIGWHPEYDLQHAGPSSISPFGSEPGLEDVLRDSQTFDGSKSEMKQERSLSEGHSPVGSLAGSDMAEDDNLAVPPDWGPPKVSVPLLNLVDVIFELQGRGWIRRQVFWMAKQVLQLGMGDAIDDFLLAKIQELRREEVMASGITWLHRILWPDGIFLTKHPSRQAGNSQEGTFEQRLEAARRAGVVREIILDRAPGSLVSLIGRKQYQRCATDLYFFLQSAVCLKQLTYRLLEMLLLSAFPELQDLVLEVRSM